MVSICSLIGFVFFFGGGFDKIDIMTCVLRNGVTCAHIFAS